MEEQKIKQYERFYFDTLEGGESYMEVCWNNTAFEEDLIRIGVKKDLDNLDSFDEIIIRQEELETLLLALTKDPSRFVRSSAKKVGVKYIPVPEKQYREYQEYKKHKNKNG